MMHKYWGRKAHNLVAHYISEHSEVGDIILDPFMGSGGALIESKKLGRHSIGVDLNPISRLIVENTTSDYSAEHFSAACSRIIESVPVEVWGLSTTRCRTCNREVTLENAVWDHQTLVRVKGRCAEHGRFVADASAEDWAIFDASKRLLDEHELDGVISYPRDELLDFVRRNGKRRMNELFSERNLLQAAHLMRVIKGIDDVTLRNLYLMVFTSMLPNISAMIPADRVTATGKSGWQISKFWVPGLHTEKNVAMSFLARVRAVAAGLSETEGVYSRASVKVYTKSAESIPEVADNSIDFVFADPPYGDSIAYLGLSMFWNSWLDGEVDYDSEIVYDPYRKKTYQAYGEGLSRVFAEMARVLKPDHHMVVTFNNRKVKFWRILMQSIAAAGFIIDKVEWQDQAVASGTQGINKRNTLRGDFVYTFINSKESRPETVLGLARGDELILDSARALLDRFGFVTSAELYCELIPELVKANAFVDGTGRDLDIDAVMASSFRYVSMVRDKRTLYGWTA